MLRPMTRLVCLIAALWLGGCANVAPWQRTRLAHPTMNESDGASASRQHLHEVREGAQGGDGSVSMGCGCN